jgi:plastocyanin
MALGMMASAHAAPKAPTVVIEGVQFSPIIVEAKVGDTVVWVNKDPFPHTVTSPGRFDSGTIESGRSWRFRVKAKGTFAYICTLHPNMKATLVVK